MTAAPSRPTREVPTSGASAWRTCAAKRGEPPRISIRLIAKRDVSRASAYAPSPSVRIPRPSASDRREGASRTSDARSCNLGSLTRPGSARGSARVADRGQRPFAGTSRCSPPERSLLQLGQLDGAEQLDLVLAKDA